MQQINSSIERLLAKTPDVERASIDLTKEDTSEDSDVSLPPIKRRKCACEDTSIAEKIEDVCKQVSGLAESISFMRNMQRSLECVVCKGIVKNPVVAKCCGRIIGCQRCVRRWLDSHATCPFCSSVIEENFALKGFDDVISCLQFALEDSFQDISPCPHPILVDRIDHFSHQHKFGAAIVILYP